MGNLLLYFLLNSRSGFVSDEELMTEVWEKNELRASSHRLWQVTRDLSFKLTEAGLREELYTRNRKRKGYTINNDIVSVNSEIMMFSRMT
jgi:DNA-binding winged helix-turn-helix (wHTH) protein